MAVIMRYAVEFGSFGGRANYVTVVEDHRRRLFFPRAKDELYPHPSPPILLLFPFPSFPLLALLFRLEVDP